MSGPCRLVLCLVVSWYFAGHVRGENIFQKIGNVFTGNDKSPSPPPALPPNALAPAPLFGPPAFQQLLAVDPNRVGPIVAKATQAAILAFNGGDPANAPNVTNGVPLWTSSVRVLLPGDNSALVTWQKNGTIGIALQGSPAAQQVLDSATPATPTTPVPLVSQVIPGAAAPTDVVNALSPLMSATGPSSLMQIIASLSGGRIPSRIVCTGYAQGGGLATVLCPWAAAAYPGTQIRLITFGAPTVGNPAMAFAVNHLVDYVVPWTVNGSLLTEDLIVETGNPQASKTTTAPWANYVGALVNAAELAQNPNATYSGIVIQGTNSSAPPPTKEGLLRSIPAFFNGNNEDAPVPTVPAADVQAAASSNNTDCPVVLCKVQDMAAASCSIYENNGSVALTQDLPQAVNISINGTDTNLAVVWNPDQALALIIFRGTSSNQGWIQDLKVRQVAYPLPSTVAGIFPGIEVHNGFLESITGVTTDAGSPDHDIGKVIQSLSKGVTPETVVCTGHSLGAALATLCGTWAATTYPTADVRVANFGSPFVGNQAYINAFRALVGRAYRVVHELDQVPSLPPLDSYRHVSYGIWLHNNEVLLEDRPQYDLNDLTWDDHACYLYYEGLKNATHVTAPTNATGAVSAPPGV